MPGCTLDVFFDRSSFRGLCRDVGMSGEDGGSFFTIILGGTPFRDLEKLRDQYFDPTNYSVTSVEN